MGGLSAEVSSTNEQGSHKDFFKGSTTSLENIYLKNLTMIIASYDDDRFGSIYLLK